MLGANNILNLELSKVISLKLKSSIEFSTHVSLQKNMNEIRNQNWHYPRLKFTISATTLSAEDYNELKALFYICQGKLNGFLLHDFTDHKIEQQAIGIGDNETKSFELFKAYKMPNYIFKRTIVYPSTSEIKVYIDQKPEFAFTCENGKITFEEAPKKDQLITVSCSFLVPVRFDTDILTATISNQGNRTIDDICLIEIK